jgi:hypothetical protein
MGWFIVFQTVLVEVLWWGQGQKMVGGSQQGMGLFEVHSGCNRTGCNSVSSVMLFVDSWSTPIKQSIIKA